MRQYGKKLLIVITMSWGIISISHGALGQPFGMGSSQQREIREQGVLCTAQGRFAFGQISGSGKDQFMLDTFTGRLWKISQTGEIGLFLSPIPYRIEDGKYAPVPECLSDLKNKKAEKKK